MRNVQINEAESIFETFWDGGESYPDHEKFTPLNHYKQEIGDNAGAEISQKWNGVNVTIWNQPDGEIVAMERNGRLNIKDFNIFRVFAAVPKTVSFRVRCMIDGCMKTVMEKTGNDTTGEFDGHISGNEITSVRVEFTYIDNAPATVTLYWFGLADSVKQQEMEKRISPYDEKWEGCFCETYEIAPSSCIYFDVSELEIIREKVKKPPFRLIMDKMRIQAADDMNINPESEISTFVANGDRRWVRDRDMNRTTLSGPMQRLAFVGLVDENPDMLKLACRMALSLSHHTYWCESIMGVFPGATWHHRSFTEEVLAKACAVVLDWAGNLLTWHGRHIIYDAIIQKALPRMESDFKTVEYIRHMNQGIVFSGGRITALVALAHEYPRYAAWLETAENDLYEMIDDYILHDGGTMEGPGYWMYTFSNILPILYILARYRGVPLAKYVPQSVGNTGNYALSMMSTTGDGTCILPVNDAHSKRMNPIIAAIYAQISDNYGWRSLYHAIMEDFSGDVEKEFIIIAKEPEEAADDILKQGYSHLPYIGQTYLLNEVSDIGAIRMQMVSGPNYFGHCHSDKGSFILEVDHKAVLIDRGVCTYNIPYASLIGKADNHNLFMPQSDTLKAPDQDRFKQGGTVTWSNYSDGIWTYTSDNLQAWENGIYIKNYRSVFSPHPCVYLINDRTEYVSPMVSAFIINTKYEMKEDEILSETPCRIVPVGWHPENKLFEKFGYDEELKGVYQYRMYTDKAEAHNVVTALIVGDYLEVLNQIIVKTEDDKTVFIYNGKKYIAIGGEWE